MLLIASPAVGGVNILQNPGFESGDLAPWFQDVDVDGSEDWNVTNADAYSGTYSATNVGNKSIRQNFDPVPTESIVEVSFWLRQPETAFSAVTFFYSDGSDGGGAVVVDTPQWEFFDVTAMLEPGKELTGWGLFGYMRGGPEEDRTFLDDARIILIPAPAALWGLALAALRPRRRRGSGS